jgi:F-type H+-transporting ATPase subunit alpha
VGGAAQTKVIKNLGGGIRLALAQYRELAAFAQFASDLDDATRKQLERGRMVTELMKQSQYATLSVSEMSITLFAVNKGYFDDVEVKRALAFESALLSFLKSKYPQIIAKIAETNALDADNEKALDAAVVDFKQNGAY